MPLYKFIDQQERVYSFHEGCAHPGNLKAEFGHTYDLDSDPGDGRWEFVGPTPDDWGPDAAAKEPEVIDAKGKSNVVPSVAAEDVPDDAPEAETPSGDALDSEDDKASKKG